MMWFKKGDKAVQILRGAGVETASIQIISKTTKDKVWIEGEDKPMFNQKGQALEVGMFGFSKRLIVLEQ